MSRGGRRPRPGERHGAPTAAIRRLRATPPHGQTTVIPSNRFNVELAERTAGVLFRPAGAHGLDGPRDLVGS